MKKRLAASVTGLIAWLFMGTSAAAMCIWFAPPGRVFKPASSMQVLAITEGRDQKLVVQPQWSGDAEDFALIMPFPEQPELSEGPDGIFDDLEDLTNPQIFLNDAFEFDDAIGVSEETRNGVRVLDQRNVGEYETTTLSANSSDEMLNWLQTNGYEVPDDKSKTLQYYIDGEADVFVALKVNVDAVNLEQDGTLRGELEPIEFSFSNRDVTLPLRLMAGEEGRVDLTIYTLGDAERYIPGAEIQFARKVTASDFATVPGLEGYDARGLWLVRNQVQFNPAAVQNDVTLVAVAEDIIVTDANTVRINPDQLDPTTGLIEADVGEIRYAANASDSALNAIADSIDQSTQDNAVLVGLIIVLGISNLYFLRKSLIEHKAAEIAEATAAKGEKKNGKRKNKA